MIGQIHNPRVVVLPDGGTAASLPGAAENGGRAPALETRALFERYVPDAWSYADLYLPEVGSRDGMPSLIDSTEADVQRFETLATRHLCLAAKGYTRQVQLRGTDTLDYAASYLYLRLRELGFNGVVCITGAQLGPDVPGSDVPRNTCDAIFASTKLPPGVYCVFGGKILDPRKTSKVSSTSLATFEQTDGGVIGYVDAAKGRLDLIQVPEFAEPTIPTEPCECSVQIITISPFTTGDAIECALQKSPDRAVIVRGYGLGGIPRRVLEVLGRHPEKLFVAATQCALGGVDLLEYEVGRNAESCGLLSTGTFSFSFATVLLHYLLARHQSADQIRAAWSHELLAAAPLCECPVSRLA